MFIKKSIIKLDEDNNNCVLYPIENNLQDFNKNLSNEIRNHLVKSFKRPKIENINNYINPAIFPILFEEVFPSIIKVDIDSRKSLFDMNINYKVNKILKIKYFYFSGNRKR